MDKACSQFLKYYDNTRQGEHFHSQLALYIAKLEKVANDYMVTRSLEYNALASQLKIALFTPSTQASTQASIAANSASSAMHGRGCEPEPMILDFPPEKKADDFDIGEGMNEPKARPVKVQTKTKVNPNTIHVLSGSPKGEKPKARLTISEKKTFSDPSSEILLGYKDAASCSYVITANTDI